MYLPWARRGNRCPERNIEREKRHFFLGMDSWAQQKSPPYREAITICELSWGCQIVWSRRASSSSMHKFVLKTRQNYFLQIWGLQLYFLIHFSKLHRSNYSVGRQTRGISSALEQYPWSTILWTIRRGSALRKVLLWCTFPLPWKFHGRQHVGGLEISREDPSLLKGPWAKHN